MGCRGGFGPPELYTTEADEVAADGAWSALGLVGDAPVVCLNTGGAFGPAKNWPVEHFASLAHRLADEGGFAVLVVCGPSERDAARAIAARAAHPGVVSLADQPLSIGLTKACIRRSALLITTDSGPRHFAAAFRVPVLTLFGPTHIAWTRTYHPQAHHLFHPVACGPLPATFLSARTSPLHARADSLGGLQRRAADLAPVPSSPLASSSRSCTPEEPPCPSGWSPGLRDFLGGHLLAAVAERRMPGVEVLALGRRPPRTGRRRSFLRADLNDPPACAAR
jgi:hypothetical protein